MIFAYDVHHSQSKSCLVVSNVAAMHPPLVSKAKCAATAFPDFREALSAVILAAGHAGDAVADHYQAEE